MLLPWPSVLALLLQDIGLYALFRMLAGGNRRAGAPGLARPRLGLAHHAANVKRWSYIQGVRPLMFLHKARWEAVDDFYRRARYIPLLYLPEEALVIALPQELADTMGLKPYGASPAGEATQATSPKP